MRLRKLSAALLAICLLLALAGCSKMENVETGSPAGAKTETTTGAEATTAEGAESTSTTRGDPNDEATFDIGENDPNVGVLSSGETIEYYTPPLVKNPGNHTVTLFVWNVDTYKTVPWKYRDTLTVRKLLEGLRHETNWDLSVSDIKFDDQNVTIYWSESSSLFKGLPKQQNKEYLVFNRKDLDAAILDSVKTTIIENLGLSYSVYYAGPHGEDLELPEVGVTIPRDEPFSSFWDY